MLYEMSRFTKAFGLLLVLLPGLLIGISGLILVTQEKQGLNGKYYPNTHWEGAPLVAQRDKVPYLSGAKGYNLISTNRYSVKWKGWIVIKHSGTYRFATHSDDGSSLRIDEQSVVDSRGTHGLKNISGEIYLEKGAYPIEILYVHSGGESVLEVFWTPPDTAEQLLPAEVLFTERPGWTIGGMVRTVGSAKGFPFICCSLLGFVSLIVLITILRPSTYRNEDRGMPENVSRQLQNCEQNLSQPTHRIHLLILVILPFCLLILNRNVFISNVFHSKIDSWINFGYFLNLPQHLKIFIGMQAYFGDRLAFLIPGYVIYKLFPPMIADYVLHFVLYYGAVLSLYYTLKMTITTRVAFLTALLFGSYYYTLWMYSWNYVDGAANTYFLLIIFFLTWTRLSPKKPVLILLAGIFTTFLLYTSLNVIWLIPGMMLYFYKLTFERRVFSRRVKKNFLSLALYFLLGMIIPHIVFSIINYLLTKDFFVLRESFWWFMRELPRRGHFFSSWKQFSSSYWLILPLIVSVTSLVMLFRQMTTKNFSQNRYVTLFQICFLIPFAIHTVFQIKGHLYLTSSCHFSYLNAPLFLAIGALASFIHNKLNTLRFSIMVAVLFIIFILPVIHVDTPEEPYINSPSLVAKAVGTIQSIDPEGSIRFFFNAPDKDLCNICGYPRFYLRGSQLGLTEVYHNIASTYLWKQCDRILSDSLPKIRNQRLLRYLRGKTKVVILTDNDSDLSLAQNSLARFHITTRALTEKTIQENDISFKMIFLEVERNNWLSFSSF